MSNEIRVDLSELANGRWRWWVHSETLTEFNGSDTSASLKQAVDDAARWIADNDHP